MARTIVENYKGFDIIFDSDDGVFRIEAESYSDKSKSYEATKKKIRDFISENSNFGTFKLVKKPGATRSGIKESKTAEVIGLDQHDAFICKTPEGEKFRIDSYSFNSWVFPETINESGYDGVMVGKYEQKVNDLNKLIREQYKKIPSVEEKFKQIIQEFRDQQKKLSE